MRALVVAAVACSAVAQAAEVELHVATDALTVGQVVTAEVQLRGAMPASVPTIAAGEGLQARYVGQSQTMSIINGHAERYVQLQYQVAALREGAWTLGPATVELAGGRTATSDAVQLRVSAAPAAGPSDVRFEVDTSITPDSVWQGQVVVLSYGWRARAEVVATDWIGLPSDGLVLVRDSQPERKEYVVDDPAGPIWNDTTSVAVLALQPGSRTWDAPIARLDVATDLRRGPGLMRSLFRQTERINVAGDPMKLEVRPLPQAPADFSGLIGNFEVSSRFDRDRARVGDSVVWTIDVAGDGTTESFKPPPAPTLPGARVYDEAPMSRGAFLRGAWRGAVTLHRTIVPTEVGTLQVPPLEITVFSTSQGRYEKLQVPGAALRVAPGEAGDAQITSFGQEPGEEAPLEDPDALRPPRRDAGMTPLASLAWGLVALPFAGRALLPLLAAAAAALRERRRRDADATPREAGPEDVLAALPPEPEARLRALDTALRLAVARATGAPPAELDLRDPDLPEAEAIRGVIQDLDRARFAGKLPPADLEPRLVALVSRLRGGGA